jgi:hypothetical protein
MKLQLANGICIYLWNDEYTHLSISTNVITYTKPDGKEVSISLPKTCHDTDQTFSQSSSTAVPQSIVSSSCPLEPTDAEHFRNKVELKSESMNQSYNPDYTSQLQWLTAELDKVKEENVSQLETLRSQLSSLNEEIISAKVESSTYNRMHTKIYNQLNARHNNLSNQVELKSEDISKLSEKINNINDLNRTIVMGLKEAGILSKKESKG